jgi:hypothetical protein
VELLLADHRTVRHRPAAGAGAGAAAGNGNGNGNGIESGEDAQAVFDAALRAVSKSRATLASGDWCGPSFSSAACASEKNYSE